MRLVLDTNVVASAMLWGGRPRELLQLGREQRIELFTSLPLLAELTDISAGPSSPTRSLPRDSPPISSSTAMRASPHWSGPCRSNAPHPIRMTMWSSPRRSPRTLTWSSPATSRSCHSLNT